jgi:putative exosortase-associated protein (TIGR04073 family)
MNRSKKFITGVLVFFLAVPLLCRPAVSFAWVESSTDSSQSRDKWEKLGRGLSNVLIGWTELVSQPYQMGHQQRLPIAIFGGIGKGAALTVARAGVGVYEILTFPFPVPAGYEPIIRPEIPMPVGTESN